MDNNINENVVLYDWLSFTSKKHDPKELIEALGLSHCPWTEVTGAKGYRRRYYFDHISIHFDGLEDMGVWVEMSGQGCRVFESLSSLNNKWEDIFNFIHSNNLHITRLDIAYDDHTGILDIDTIAEDTRSQHYISCFRAYNITFSSKGTSVIVGSMKSLALIRIYDKAAERGYVDGRHWVRVELQLRGKRAEAFSKLDIPIGEAFAGVVLNYLRYVTPDASDVNRSRWTTTDYWADFLGDVGRIRLYVAPGSEYNEDACKRYVQCQAGNAIAAMLEMYEYRDFIAIINSRPCAPNPKYDLIVKAHHAKQEAFAQRMEIQALCWDECNT